MNLQELDSYNLADAVKFNDRLNPRIWDGEKMRPEVRDKLLEIAADFKESLGLSDLEVKDITVSGSNAGYTYTPYSDIDLHLVVDIPRADEDEVYRELFDAKKFQYNELHNIKIGGYDVELYVENANKPPVSQGVFSVLNNDWIHIPRKRRATVDDDAVRSKYEDYKHRIDSAVDSNDTDKINTLAKKIKTYRQAGLDAHGELGPENLAYKMLRNQGYIEKLYKARTAARDAELSLAEQNREKKPFVYGYKTMEDATATPDGVNPTTQMFLNETDVPPHEEIIKDFIKFARKKIGLKKLPKFKLHKDPKWSTEHQSFGRYTNETDTIDLAIGERHIMDILRTLAHELQHRKQDERETMPPDAGETGSPYENEAHAVAGVVMREYANLHPEYFRDVPVSESASGYIPKNKKEARLPQYAMALSADIKPGETGRQANKMALKTDAQGKPALLMKTANMIGEASKPKSYGYNSTPLSQVPGEREDELGNQEATGPEFPPQMPAGTTKVDVSDLTDWYRLGMDISDMDDADPEDYNQGPPQTVIVFPSDKAEQGYLKQFKRLGLKTHDLDPDVEGGEDVLGKHLHEELQAFKTQDLFEVKMTSKNLAKLARDIPGVKVGLEFEMIVPNASVEDDGDLEPDYDEDERVRDIDDAVSFFDDGDYNDRASLRRLRENMESDFFDWQMEQIDERWNSQQGWEFFTEYLDREDPFDPEDHEEEAYDYVLSNNPTLHPDSEEFNEKKNERLQELNSEYYQEQWDEQGRNYDYAREEFEEEQRDDVSESDWLDAEGIRYASDVESNYGHVTWPYYRSSDDDDTDIERVALDFMNGIGADSVAYADSYHGRYKKWVGNGWVDIGNNKPDDCFAIEPDGSLHGDDSDDAGLEFVSPPTPLEQVPDLMKRVQNWASSYGVYTGKSNGTSIHTNISVPGYDLDKLDYLKAALLLGDEYVLREFDRIGNTYAAPAIEKVKQLVQQKPEKAKELLDKMKSQLNAEASKLIHSGQTNKFTSINTKDNRVEFRSPGGDYLSIIADNPQKMIDTINRMVVTLDAAMDPTKYKEEYQKKLYKVLTGQAGGREAKTGAKQEMKKDDKDLINIFSRYAAGELPKAALKSFVRQAQLERKTARGEGTPGQKYWWNVQWDSNRRMEVVAANKKEAREVAAKEWGVPADQLAVANVTMLRPYEEPAQQSSGPTLNGRPSNPDGNYVIANRDSMTVPVYRFMAAGMSDATEVLNQWRAEHPGEQWVINPDANRRFGQPGESQPIPGSTLDLQRQRAAAAQQQQGNWGIWIQNADRFANQPGEYPRGVTPPLYRFPSREAAEQWIEQQRAARPNMRTDIEVREIEPAGALPDIFPELPGRVNYELYDRNTGQSIETFLARNDREAGVRLDDFRNFSALARQNPQWDVGVRRGPGVDNTEQPADEPSSYELYRISDGRTVTAPAGNPIVFRATDPADAESKIARYAADFNLGAPELFAVRSVLNVPAQSSGEFTSTQNVPREGQPRNLVPTGPGPWEIYRISNGESVRRLEHTNRAAAEEEARSALGLRGLDPELYGVRTQQSTLAATGGDAAQVGTINTANEPTTGSQVGQTYNPSGTGSFTGQWLILNPDNQVIYRFGGIGNSQSDANRIAMNWLTQNPGQMVDGVTVVPEMG